MIIKNFGKQPKLKIILFIASMLVFFFFFKVSKVASSETLKRQAENSFQYQSEESILRGEIRDRKGKILAYSLNTISLFVYPESIGNFEIVADTLDKLNIIKKEDFLEIVNNSEGFQWIRRDIDSYIVKQIINLGIEGLGAYYDNIRIYSRTTEGSNIIGSLDRNGNGISGIEYSFNDFLISKRQNYELSKNDRGKIYLKLTDRISYNNFINNIYLTIDIDIQEAAYHILEKTINKYSAESGVIIVMKPESGDIISMVSISESSSNLAVSWQYEPGSTFKLVAAIAALSEERFENDEIVEIGNCRINIGEHVINDAEEHGSLTFEEAVIHSSNVSFVNIANKVGSNDMYKYCLLFGFGEKTGISLPGEVSGYIPKLRFWNDITIATASFGQGISVNPLQMCIAFSAIANDGCLVAPRIVDRYLKENGEFTIIPVDTIRRVTTSEVADNFTELLVKVVENGTAKNAFVEGFDIAGKTGTAEIPSPDGGYFEDKYIASFIGFYPSTKPEYLIYVVIDKPMGVYYGGSVAAPAFKELVLKIKEIENYQRVSI